MDLKIWEEVTQISTTKSSTNVFPPITSENVDKDQLRTTITKGIITTRTKEVISINRVILWDPV